MRGTPPDIHGFVLSLARFVGDVMKRYRDRMIEEIEVRGLDEKTNPLKPSRLAASNITWASWRSSKSSQLALILITLPQVPAKQFVESFNGH